MLSPSSCHTLPAVSMSGRAGCCDRWTGAAQRNGFRWAIRCKLVELLQSHKCKELEAILLRTLGSWKPRPSFYKALLKTQLLPLHVAVYRYHRCGDMEQSPSQQIQFMGLSARKGRAFLCGQQAELQGASSNGLSFSLLWSFFNEQLLLPSSLLTPLQHLQEVNDRARQI